MLGTIVLAMDDSMEGGWDILSNFSSDALWDYAVELGMFQGNQKPSHEEFEMVPSEIRGKLLDSLSCSTKTRITVSLGK